MIANDQELKTTLERISWFQQRLSHLRKTEKNPVNYRAAASGFLAEIDRMQLEARDYFSSLPTETAGGSDPAASALGSALGAGLLTSPLH